MCLFSALLLLRVSPYQSPCRGGGGDRVIPSVQCVSWLGPQGPKAWSSPPQPFWGGCSLGERTCKPRGEITEQSRAPCSSMCTTKTTNAHICTHHTVNAGCVCGHKCIDRCSVPKPGDYTHTTNQWETIRHLVTHNPHPWGTQANTKESIAQA